jgi:sialic acid synthase SpsE|tara:strand:- start:798 stop:1562 length:765 start_codon:yes stop_codon:yes gene_type:complete
MSCKLYANIGVAHENDIEVLKARVISAAQCNADAIVINKTTPIKLIPDEKKYLSINSKWGALPYLEVATKSELTVTTTKQIVEFCEQIGIPIIWSITDIESLMFVIEEAEARHIKIHSDAVDYIEIIRYCSEKELHTIVPINYFPYVQQYSKKGKRLIQLYHTAESFPAKVEELQLSKLDVFVTQGFRVGYEGREEGIFPTMAVAYKGVDYIEKYLGEEDSDNGAILQPEQFYDLWQSMNIMFDADQQHPSSDT